MDVKDAVRLAKAYVRDVFADENVSDVGLEETRFDESANRWTITIGFRRPYGRVTTTEANHHLGGYLQAKSAYENRWYKTVLIDAKSGDIVSMHDLVLRSAA